MTTLPATLFVVLGFYGLGRLVASDQGPADRIPARVAFTIVAGWATASIALTVSALLGVPLHATGWTALLAGLAGLVLPGRNTLSRIDALRLLAVVSALCAPLLAIAATAPPVMFDDLSHWLPNARFVFDHDALPSARDPLLWSGMPAYPYGGPFVSVLTSLLLGQWTHTPIVLFTIVMYGLFGVVLVDEVRSVRGAAPGVGAIAAGLVVVLMLNPTFDPRITLSAHMDGLSAVLAGLGGLAVWQTTGAAARGDVDTVRLWCVRGGFAGLALVFARDTNLVLIAGLWFALAVVTIAEVRGRMAPVLIRSLALYAVPLSGLAVWRWYRRLESMPVPIPIRPIRDWDWDAGPRVLASLFTERLPAHPWLGAAAALVSLLVLVAGWLTLHRGSRDDRRLVAIAAVTASVWVVFLLWTYIATAADVGVASANSAWRFIGQLGPLALLTLGPSGRMLAARVNVKSARVRTLARFAGAIAIALLLAVPVLRPRYWQNACRFPDITAARLAARSADARIGPNDRVVVVHTSEALWLSTAVRYEQQIEFTRIKARNASPEERIAQIAAATGQPTAIFDFRPIDRSALIAGGGIPPTTLYRRQEGADPSAAYVPTTIVADAVEQSCRVPVKDATP